MYFTENKVLPTRTNIVCIELNDGKGYLYIDLPVYNKLFKEIRDDSFFENKKMYTNGPRNRKLFEEIFNTEPLVSIRNLAFLIENDMSEYSIDKYIDAIGYLLANITVMSNSIDNLFEKDIMFTLPKEDEYKYIKSKFLESCLSTDMPIATQMPVMQQVQTSVALQTQVNTNEPEWKQYAIRLGKDRYLGYGEFKEADGSIVTFGTDEMKLIEEFLGYEDPIKKKRREREEAKKKALEEANKKSNTINTRTEKVNKIEGDAKGDVPSYFADLLEGEGL